MPTVYIQPINQTAAVKFSSALYRQRMIGDLAAAFVLERPLTTINEASVWLWLTSDRGMTEADGLAADVAAAAKLEA